MIDNPFPIKSLGQAPSHLTTCENAMNYSTEQPVSIAQPLRERFLADAGPSALLDQAANLAIRFTAAPRDYLGPATDAMKTRAALGEKIAAAIRVLHVTAAPAAAPKVEADERAALEDERNAAYPVPESPDASVNLRAVAGRSGFTRGWKARAAFAAAPMQAQEPVIWYDARAGAVDAGLLYESTRSLSIVGSSEGPFGQFTTPLYRAQVQPVAMPDGWQATDDEIAAWNTRHDLRISSATDRRAVFEDAQTLRPQLAAPAAQGDSKELTDAQIDQLAIQIYGSSATAQERQLARAAIAASKAVKP